jgi:ATP-dependent RNA helicase RhlE
MSESITSFDEFKLNKQLLAAISAQGFEKPTPIQQKCIPAALGGNHVLGIAQTGTGKTAAYLLPLLMKVKYAQGMEPKALIIAPTKELALQIDEHAKKLAVNTDLRILCIYGGIGPKTQIEEINKGIDILVATPGRFLDIYLRGEIQTKQIKTLIIDEADKMMDMGFMPQLRKILEVIPSKRQNLLFSATFHPIVERLSTEFLEFPVRIEITPQSTAVETVEQELYHVPNFKTKINLLEYFLKQTDIFNKVMVFTRTKKIADNIFHFIDRKNYGPVKVVHSNKGQNTRINAMNEFKEGKLRVLVATDVASRGIDVSDVSHVINFDVPYVYVDYVHRIGRTGRALKQGTAITFANEAELYHIQKIEKIINDTIPVLQISKDVEIEKTSFEEKQEMAREIDRQRRKEDPDFKGAFHEKKYQIENKKRRK